MNEQQSVLLFQINFLFTNYSSIESSSQHNTIIMFQLLINFLAIIIMIHIITNYKDCNNNEISTVHKGAIHSEPLRRRENQECLNIIE